MGWERNVTLELENYYQRRDSEQAKEKNWKEKLQTFREQGERKKKEQIGVLFTNTNSTGVDKPPWEEPQVTLTTHSQEFTEVLNGGLMLAEQMLKKGAGPKKIRLLGERLD